MGYDKNISLAYFLFGCKVKALHRVKPVARPCVLFLLNVLNCCCFVNPALVWFGIIRNCGWFIFCLRTNLRRFIG